MSLSGCLRFESGTSRNSTLPIHRITLFSGHRLQCSTSVVMFSGTLPTSNFAVLPKGIALLSYADLLTAILAVNLNPDGTAGVLYIGLGDHWVTLGSKVGAGGVSSHRPPFCVTRVRAYFLFFLPLLRFRLSAPSPFASYQPIAGGVAKWLPRYSVALLLTQKVVPVLAKQRAHLHVHIAPLAL